MIKIPTILGPTAIGKSSLAFSLAKKINGEIVSCDSRQIYKYLDIGTAKPTKAETNEIPHHLIDIIDPSEEYSATRWADDADIAINDIITRGKTPIITGGTFFYLQALQNGFDNSIGPDAVFRKECNEKEDINPGYLYNELKRLNPEKASTVKELDRYRVIRALQFIRDGSPKATKKELNYDFYTIVLETDRAKLYSNINSRVDKMIFDGLYDEFVNLTKKSYNRDSPGIKCVGYREFFNYIDKVSSFEQSVEAIKQNSRKYAKRQLTWLRNRVFSDLLLTIDTSTKQEMLVSTIIENFHK